MRDFSGLLRVRDHCLFIIDFLKSCLVSVCLPSIVWAAAMILNSIIPRAAEK